MSDHHALYRFFDRHGRLLYVGITNNPSERWKKHQHDKPWWGEVASIKLEPYASREDVLEAERQAIREEQPYYNTVHDRQGPDDLLFFKFGALPLRYSRLVLSLDRAKVTKARLDEIERVLDLHDGVIPLAFRLHEGGAAWSMYPCERRVSLHRDVIDGLRVLLGPDGVHFE